MAKPQLISTDDPKYKSWMKQHVRPMMLHDRMHGFLFFADFKDFRQFDLNTIDPLQRANVPLLERDRTISDNQRFKTPLLLMTDYGSCNPHEAAQGAVRPEEEYYVQFWQHIDVFNYFAHGHIAIPPPTLINAAHRNGVQIIGTLIFEGGGDPDTVNMLEVDNEGKNWLADKLAHIAAICGFDGWLLNVESRVSEPTAGAWDHANGMIKFIKNLQTALQNYHVPNGGKIIWYDAVTRDNEWANQKCLNEQYIDFARTAKSVIVDYPYNDWDATGVKAQTMLMDQKDSKGLLGRENVYLGRNIYREMGNGLPLKAGADERVGFGLFATGWCFQQFYQPAEQYLPLADTTKFQRRMFRSEADKYMWTGTPDLAELQSAGVLGRIKDHTIPNTEALTTWKKQMDAKDCITAYARQYTAGSQAFFYTNYGTSMTYRKETNDYYAHLNEHSVWPALQDSTHMKPLVHLTTNLTRAVDGTDLTAPFVCSIGIENKTESKTAPTDTKCDIYLHYVHLKHDAALALSMRYKRITGLVGIRIWVCAWSTTFNKPMAEAELTENATLAGLPLGTGQGPIVAIGLRIEAQASLFEVIRQNKHILDIIEIVVKPQDEKYNPLLLRPTDVDLVRAPEDVNWTRLKWTVPSEPKVEIKAQHLPYSALTGSFSHFDIYLNGNGKEVWRSHTLAYVWDEQSVQKLGFTTGKNIDIQILGTQFDGTTMEVFKGQKKWP